MSFPKSVRSPSAATPSGLFPNLFLLDVTGLSPENTEKVLNLYLKALVPPKLNLSSDEPKDAIDRHVLLRFTASPHLMRNSKIDILEYTEPVFSPMPAIDPTDEAAVKAQFEKRMFIAKEIAQTERNYTNDLGRLSHIAYSSLFAHSRQRFCSTCSSRV